MDQVRGGYVGEASDLAVEMGLVGISGVGCRRSERYASISGTDEPLETQHALEHLGAKPYLFEQNPVEMPRADGERGGDLLDSVRAQQL
jgi:hypothetical protein